MKTMRLLYGAACAALAGSLLSACTNDEDVMMNNDEASAKTPMTFTAETAQTRTALGDDGKAVNWVAGDAIAVCGERSLTLAKSRLKVARLRPV